MKVYVIALFLLFLNVGIMVVQEEPLFNAYDKQNLTLQYGLDEDFNFGGVSINGSTAPNLPTDDNNIFSQIISFFQTIWQCLTGLPHILSSMGVPQFFCDIVQVIIGFIYTIGAVQFITGRWLKFAE